MTSVPFFSVCIPQHDRTDFLLRAIASLAGQGFRDFEICISDDNSQDGRQQEVEAALAASGLAYKFKRRETNGRYDANLRTAIALAEGRYCFLLGNDDALASDKVLERAHTIIEREGPCGVAIADFENYRTGKRVNRIRATGNRGSGPEVAAHHFRNFSFVSGVMLDRTLAQQFATDKWDGSEMYQTYIGCRIIARGHNLLEIGESLIRKDIMLQAQSVDSYAQRPRVSPCPIQERPVPLVKLGRLVADAIAVNGADPNRRKHNTAILLQLLIFTYPFWLFEYRRVQSWNYAAGIALAMRPSRITEKLELGAFRSWLIKTCYFGVTLLGLIVPRRSFEVLVPSLYRWAKLRSSA